MFIFDLIFLAAVVYVGYNAYKTYVANGNSVSPLDIYISALVKNILRQK